MMNLRLRLGTLLGVCLAVVCLWISGAEQAEGALYADPGWAYFYDGNEAFYNDPDGPHPDYVNGGDTNHVGQDGRVAALVDPTVLDPGCDVAVAGSCNEEWFHKNQWEGSAPGDPLGAVPVGMPPIPPPAPGGVGTYTESGTTFLRMQDPGNPRSFGWADKWAQANSDTAKQEGNNRKIAFAHDISEDATYSGDGFVLDKGITITFRTRIATAATGPLDDIFPEGGGTLADTLPWPTDGVGYQVANDGRGMFHLTHTSLTGQGQQMAFSLLDTNTININDLSVTKTGLVMNNPFVPGVGVDPDTNMATDAILNIVEINNAELVEWQEFWITVEGLPCTQNGTCALSDNTHEVNVYHNGLIESQTFEVILGQENEFGTGPYMAMGLSSGTRLGAFDLDFYAYKEGVHIPEPNTLPGDYNDDDMVDAADYTVYQDTFSSMTDLRADGDSSGTIDQPDYDIWKSNFGSSSGIGSLADNAAVPEPTSLAILVTLLVPWILRTKDYPRTVA